MTERKQNLVVPSPIWYGILPLHRKLYPAIAPRRRLDALLLMIAVSSRRRRITEFSTLNSSAARERSSQETDKTTLGSNRTCTNYIQIHPHIKVLRELERTSSFSKATVSRRSPVPLNYIPQSLPVEGGWLCPAARERFSQGTDETILERTWTCTNYIQIHPHIKVLRSFFKSDRSPRSPFPRL